MRRVGTTRPAAAIGVIIWLCSASAPAAELGDAQIEIHYAPAENLEAIDRELIDSAGETIDMAAYVLTDWTVIDALVDAAERGVRVRIWRDRSATEHTNADELARLTATEGVELRVKHSSDLMHLKSYVVDGQILRTGAANFSASGEKRQDNDLVVIRDPALAARFEANFERLWSGR
jgi:phosphatidylserine/phosphatidylglycerophosphate/cardiolipin synthase-like enzyme